MTWQTTTERSDRAMAAIASVRRAVAIERWAEHGFDVELIPFTSLATLIEPWTALATRAVEPNVFLEPAFALAAAPVFGTNVQAGLVWSQSSPRELLGLFPVSVESRRYGLPLPMLSSWVHAYGPFGTPLVHRDAVEPVISAWLDHIAADRSLPSLMLMSYINDDGAFAVALDRVLASRDIPMAIFDRHQRALLTPEVNRAGYVDRSVAPKQRRELARKWRRLQDGGATEFAQARPAAAATALDDFFRLEASGWKGRIGTAAAKNERIHQFIVQALQALVAQDQAMIHQVRVGDQTIASAVTLRSGNSAWGWKIAYDETFARQSPGVQLLVRLTEELLRDESLANVDSLATSNHPMVDHIWRERRTMSDRLIGVKRSTLVPFGVVSRLEALLRLTRAAAKTIRDHLRGRHRPESSVTRAGATDGE
jgi:CelD/BcsL family acetyltransferase involved in cellulose biosynthesis